MMNKKEDNEITDRRKSSQILTLFIMFVLTSVFVGVVYFVYQNLMIDTSISHSKNQMPYASIIKKADNITIAAHYPRFVNEKINDDLSTLVNEYVDKFTANNSDEEDKIFYLDYDLFQVKDQFASIVILLAVGSDVDDLVLSPIAFLNYDLNSGEKITLDDIFISGYEKKLAAHLRKNLKDNNENLSSDFYRNTKAIKDNFKTFTIDNDRLDIYYESSLVLDEDKGLITISFNLNQLAFLLSAPINSDPIVTPCDYDEMYLRYIDPDLPMVALTYDDGPYAPTTEKILDYLLENNSAATFFLVGNRIYPYADTLKRMLKQGNEIGNHSYTHKYSMTKLNKDDLRKDLKKTQDDLYEYVDDYTIRFMRPTYGNYNQSVKENAGYAMVNWSIDTLDWQSRDSRKIYDIVIRNVKDGDIILMHDLYQSTVEASERIIPELVSQGYQLVTLSELFEYKKILPEVGKVYYSTYQDPR